MKHILVCGADGFIGSHLIRRLRKEGYIVRGIDLKYPEFSLSGVHDFVIGDLRNPAIVSQVTAGIDEVYQLAADMGGAGYLFTGDHDADVMANSALINLNVLRASVAHKVKKIFYSSSACVYPEHSLHCKESSVYPAAPDSEYGWEKLFSERLYLSHARNYGIEVRIARLHNIYGPEGTWNGGREKAPAAICRKIAHTPNGGEIEIWGNGEQLRSFLYIDECIEGIRRLMDSDYGKPLNIGSEEMVSISELANMVAFISGKSIQQRRVDGPVGVAGRTSDNIRIRAWSRCRLTIITNTRRDCYVDAMNTAARAATGKWLISAADDWFPAPGWNDELRRLVPDPLTTQALVNVVNGHHNHSIYPILTRAYYERPNRGGHPNGEMFYPEYMSMGSDDDISRVARQDGAWIDSPMVFDHQHPWRGQPQHDTHNAYAHVQSNEAFEVGRAVQAKRIQEGWIK